MILKFSLNQFKRYASGRQEVIHVNLPKKSLALVTKPLSMRADADEIFGRLLWIKITIKVIDQGFVSV
jgi:hypothetical protein